MSEADGLINLGEIYSEGVSSWNEHWWHLKFDPTTGELVISRSWSYISGGIITDGEKISLLRELDPQDRIFQKAVEYIQQLANRKG